MVRFDGAWRRRHRTVDGLVALGCAAAAVLPDARSGLVAAVLLGPAPPAAAGVLIGLLTGAAAAYRRRYPWLLLAGALLGWLVLGAYPALFAGLYAVGCYGRSMLARAALTVLTLLAVGIPIWWAVGPDGALPISAVLCVLPVLVGLFVAARRDLVAGLRERAERIEREQQLRFEQARAQERAQIARDMHDVVTHRVSLIVLHATALEAAQGRGAVELARQIRGIGREALDELRALVGVLRDGQPAPLAPQPGLADLPELVAESRAAGTAVTLSVPAAAPPLSLLVEHVAYRVVQEALTNVRKHAPGAPTEVRVEVDRDACRLVVRNHGARVAVVPVPGGGHGLLGIRERVRLVGGELTAQPTSDGGFEVLAVVPTSAPAPGGGT